MLVRRVFAYCPPAWAGMQSRQLCATIRMSANYRKASTTLFLLNVFFAPEVTEPALKVLERDWHQDILVMVRDRLPKVLVVLLLLFGLLQVLKFLVRRMDKLATRQTAHLRSTQLRTMATIVRATGYCVLGLVAFF